MGKAGVLPIYTSKGEAAACLAYPHLFNLGGEWIGWITTDRQVYAINGRYAGWLSEDWRILRKRTTSDEPGKRTPPAPPERLVPPAHFPLAPLLADLPFHIIDVLQDEPDLLPPLDLGERYTTWDQKS